MVRAQLYSEVHSVVAQWRVTTRYDYFYRVATSINRFIRRMLYEASPAGNILGRFGWFNYRSRRFVAYRQLRRLAPTRRELAAQAHYVHLDPYVP